jgi:hypothetical protein
MGPDIIFKYSVLKWIASLTCLLLIIVLSIEAEAIKN